MKRLFRNLKKYFIPKITMLEGLSKDKFTHPIYWKRYNTELKKGALFYTDGSYFGDKKLERDKKVLLLNRYTNELRIGTLVAGGDFTGPVFDKGETLIEYDVIGVELD